MVLGGLVRREKLSRNWAHLAFALSLSGVSELTDEKHFETCRNSRTDTRAAPGTAAIEYERVVLNRSIESENVFAGKRTQAMDDAWAKLIKRVYL